MVRVVGIGDLVTDIYYVNGKIIGACGGKTFSNICANLGFLGVKTAVLGVCGNDLAGKIAVSSLKEVGVDTKDISIKDIKTRLFHIDEVKTTKKCPYCNKETWYSNTQINKEGVISKILSDDIIVIDNISRKAIEIIDNVFNKVVIDIGYYHGFDYFKIEELINLIQNKFEIINMNERVYKYLIKRLCINDLVDLYKIFKTKLLIITKGSDGADFVFDNKVISKKIENIGKEIDSNGAGDAFFAVFLKAYIDNNYCIDDDFIEQAFLESTCITKEVVERIGARSHLTKLYNLNNSICSCNKSNI